MKARKIQRKLSIRQAGHAAAREVAKRRSGANYNDKAWNAPGSRNPKKS